MFKTLKRHRTYWRIRWTLRRWTCALAYARCRLSQDDALTVMLECQRPAECHILLTLNVDTTLSEMLEEYEDHPRLQEFVADRCERVGHKWEDGGEGAYYAREWAIEKAVEYAAQDGVTFRKLDEEAA